MRGKWWKYVGMLAVLAVLVAFSVLIPQILFRQEEKELLEGVQVSAVAEVGLKKHEPSIIEKLNYLLEQDEDGNIAYEQLYGKEMADVVNDEQIKRVCREVEKLQELDVLQQYFPYEYAGGNSTVLFNKDTYEVLVLESYFFNQPELGGYLELLCDSETGKVLMFSDNGEWIDEQFYADVGVGKALTAQAEAFAEYLGLKVESSQYKITPAEEMWQKEIDEEELWERGVYMDEVEIPYEMFYETIVLELSDDELSTEYYFNRYGTHLYGGYTRFF